MKKILLISVLFSTLSLSAHGKINTASAPPAETKEQHDTRMQWWRDAKFGMFIHWGLYAQAAGYWHGQPPPKDEDQRGEWIMQAVRPPVAEYAEMAETFNPVKFDADQWIAMAKEAGVKYIVITAKHHEGFAMFRTAASPFNICEATPFKRDPLRELADACKKYDIKLGIYYSQAQDWHHPGGLVYREGPWDPVQKSASIDDYLKSIAVPQITELLTHYGPVAELWWDTPGSIMTAERCKPIADLVAKLQPDVVMNNRLGGDYEGDISTPEGFIPATGIPNRDWESCMTMANTWGYKKDVKSYTPSRDLIIKLIDVASKGGNLLLNVSPMDTGEIPAAQVERMHDIGKWMKINSEAIYCTKPTIFGAEAGSYDASKKDKHGDPLFIPGDKWRCTTTENRIFIHLLKWPGSSFTLNDVPNPVTKAYLLADPERTSLQVKQDGGTVTVTLPVQSPDPQISVLALEVAGPLVRPSNDPLAQTVDGSLTLAAVNAEIRNDGGSMPDLVLRGNMAVSWTKPEDHLRWNATVNKPGKFKVFIRYTLQSKNAPASFILNAAGKELRGTLPATKGGKPTGAPAGTVTIDQTGIVPVTLKPDGMKESFINFDSLLFVPEQ